MGLPPSPGRHGRLLRCRHGTRQALQVALHTGRRALELREVLFGQTVEPECAGLVTKLLVHRISLLLSAALAQLPPGKS
jgi:hypothetical protein